MFRDNSQSVEGADIFTLAVSICWGRDHGDISFSQPPCPVLILHGDDVDSGDFFDTSDDGEQLICQVWCFDVDTSGTSSCRTNFL